MKLTNVLSLFDGMSCAQIALNRAGIQYDNYFASEIDKFAIAVTQNNYPDTIQLGDIREIKAIDLPEIDLLIGGSPCQGFSVAGKHLNFKDSRSKLFFEYYRLLQEIKPKYFILENVKMRKDIKNKISELMGVNPILINSSLVSAQSRNRLYWTNIQGVEQPKDKNIMFRDVIDWNCTDWLSERGVRYVLTTKYRISQAQEIKDKAWCVMAQKGTVYQIKQGKYRYLNSEELEKLQTVPVGYTAGVSKTQRQKMLGNGFTVDVIVHILNYIK